ncbi:MAG: hypothetical protein ACKPKO_05800, partial [Candidatus Fonsibacter sp.]
NLVSAAYWAATGDEAPEQVARDGGYYAVFMCSLAATPPIELFVDCAGTLKCVSASRATCTGSDHARAHWWTKFWAQFEGEAVSARKTKAHASEADIAQGRSTYLEKAANGHADRLAKLGAGQHPLPADVVDQYRGLVQLVREAAGWAARKENWMREAGLWDAE